ncbi:MAG: hypothetical protein JRE47_10135 [Deltaproteobacteria bacterium]|nr:hypothetical protein [Deltaproteobacteria bacterium]
MEKLYDVKITTKVKGTGVDAYVKYFVNVRFDKNQLNESRAEKIKNTILESSGRAYVGGEHNTLWHYGGQMNFGAKNLASAKIIRTNIKAAFLTEQDAINATVSQIRYEKQKVTLANYSGNLYGQDEKGKFFKI